MMRAESLSESAALAIAYPERIGLLAGWGRYPLVLAQALQRHGCRVVGLGLRGHADPELARCCEHFEWVGLAQLGRAIGYFRRQGLREVTMAGKVFKHQLFQRHTWFKHVPDLRAVRAFWTHFLIARHDRRDDTLLLTLIREFARDGLHFAPATNFLPELLVKFAQLTRRAPSTAERHDIEYGWRVAKEIGRYDVGQCVVVKGRAALAIEAIEGTDACIERAGHLCPEGNLTVVKVAKPRQDMRFDVPTIGLQTLESMLAAGARCLAIEAGRTIVLDEPEVIRLADQQGVSIIALDAAGQFPEADPQGA